MTADTARTVVVARHGDVIRVGPSDDGVPDLLTSVLELPGGDLAFAVSDPARAPEATVIDVASALPWIARVFGEQIASAVAARADGDEHDEESVVALAPGPDAERLCRLALGQWLWRYWPQTSEVPGLNTALLRIELAALSWEADESFGALQPAGALLAGHLEELASAVRILRDELRSDAGVLETPLARSIVFAVDALVVGEASLAAGADGALLEEWDTFLAEVATVRDDVDGEVAATSASTSTALVEELNAWLAVTVEQPIGRREEFALAAGDDGESIRGRSSVDWSQVPPRVLDWSEDTISWVAEPVRTGEWHVSIRVSAVPGSDDDLFARLYLPDGSAGSLLPVLVLPLTPVGSEYAAEGRLHVDDPAALSVDVFHAAATHPPRVSAQSRQEAAVERDAARTLIRRRATAPESKGAARAFGAEGSRT